MARALPLLVASLGLASLGGCVFSLAPAQLPPKPAAAVNLAGPNAITSLVTIDGTPDTIWRGQPTQDIDRAILGKVASADDLSGNFSVLYDQNNLYFLAVVTDDHMVGNATNPLNGDGVELFIDTSDLSQGRSSSYGAQQTHFVFPWVVGKGLVPWERSGRTADAGYAVAALADGYEVEASIAWDTLGMSGPPAPGQSIGLEVMIDDADGSGGVTKKLAWSGQDDDAASDPRKFGTGKLSRGLVFQQTTSAPLLDGIVDQIWSKQPVYALRHAINLQGKRGDATFSANLSGIWDAQNLYLYFDLRDSTPVPNPSNSPLSDGVEVFANDGRGDATYGARDVHVLYGYQSTTPAEAHGLAGAFAAGQANVAGASGYRVEMRIPWGMLDVTAKEGVLAGLEVWADNFVPPPDVKPGPPPVTPDGGMAHHPSWRELSGIDAPSDFDGGFRTQALVDVDGGDPVHRPSDVGVIELE